MTHQKTVLLIAGPTAVGKTSVALDMARQLDTAIVSADSRQCYHGMAIGTAQPSAAERAQVKHYFIDAFPVTRPLSAADYEELALGYLAEILAGQDTAVVCGGTGLYIKALCEGLDEMPPADPRVDREVNERYQAAGISWLQDALRAEDPAAYSRMDVQNPARLLRALVFKRSTGSSILDYRAGRQKERPFRIIKIGLELPREVLYQRINERVLQMMQAGLPEEARALYPLRHLKNLQTVGYAELFAYFDGKHSLDSAVQLIQQHSRNYAKRQLTWFKKDPEFHWLQADAPDITEQIRKQLHERP